MPENREHGKGPITLEQLLALKRSERPDGAFWEEFDREFQRRRLATLVNTPPWYVSALHGFTRLSRWLAPVAAVAAAAAFGYIELTSESVPDEQNSTTQMAEGNREQRVTILQEEYVSPVKQVEIPSSTSVAASPALERMRYGIREIGMASESPRQFVTVASPHVLAASDEDSRGYLIRTLTASPAFGASASPVSASF